MHWIKSFLLLTLGLLPSLAFATSYDIALGGTKGARHIFLDDSLYDIAHTGDVIEVSSQGTLNGTIEQNTVAFVIYSHGKTALVFKEPFKKDHSVMGKITVIEKKSSQTAPANQRSFGTAYANAKLTKDIPANTKRIWLDGRWYRSLESKNIISLSNRNKYFSSPVSHVLSFRDKTAIFLKTPTPEWISKPTVTLESNLSAEDLAEFLNDLENKSASNQNNTPETQQPVVNNPQPLKTSRTDNLGQSQNAIAGIDDMNILGFSVQNPNIAPATITAINLQLDTQGAAKPENFSLSAFVGGVQQGSSTTGTSAKLTNLAVQIPANGTTNFELVVDTEEKAANDDGIKDSFKLSVSGITATTGSNRAVLSTVNEATNKRLAQTALTGPEFTLLQGGTLKAELGGTIFSDILVGNQVDVELLKIRVSAQNDEIQITDLHLQNNTSDWLDSIDNWEALSADQAIYKLYASNGVMITEAAAIKGKIHFELSNSRRIRVPKNGSTEISIRADIKEVNNVDQSGRSLRLQLDTTAPKNGIEAVTAGSGAVISKQRVLVPEPVRGEVFKIVKSQLSIRHSVFQPKFVDPPMLDQEVYHFNIKLDQNTKPIVLDGLKLRVDLQGMKFKYGPIWKLKPLTNYISDDIVVASLNSSSTGEDLHFDFNYPPVLKPGTEITFALIANNIEDDENRIPDDDAFLISLTDAYLRNSSNTGTTKEKVIFEIDNTVLDNSD